MKKQLLALTTATLSATTFVSCEFLNKKYIRFSGKHKINYMEKKEFDEIPIDCNKNSNPR